MTKPVLTKRSPKQRNASKSVTLVKRRVRDENGEIRTLYRLDAASGKFDVQFSKAFGLSVAKARKENKRVTGHPDVGRKNK